MPPGVPFLQCLAEKLLGGGLGDLKIDIADPLGLARVTIFLPTQRACRSLRQALVDQNDGKPLLLPDIRAIGDVDIAELASDPDLQPDLSLALAPAFRPMECRIYLAMLIAAWGRETAAGVLHLDPLEAPVIPGSSAMAARLAGELFKLIESIETEGIDLARLADLVPDNHSAYWDISLAFLKIVSEHWPEILAENQKNSPATARNEMIRGEAARIAKNNDGPVIAAGSTGSVPATAELLKAIAHLPQGAVILPGLDLGLEEEVWLQVGKSPSHPQHTMARLIEKLDIERIDVRELVPTDWKPEKYDRAELIRAAMLPEEATAAWSRMAKDSPITLAKATEDLAWVEAATPQEEALVIALMLREVAGHPTRTAALVTPDRNLARRVQSELARWRIVIDDSAGQSLHGTTPGIFARHAAEVLIHGLHPVPLLALLKHPFLTIGLSPGKARAAARFLERHALRGPRPEAGIAGLRERLDQAREIAKKFPAKTTMIDGEINLAEGLVARLGHALQSKSWPDGETVPVVELVTAHQQFCVELAKDETGEADRFWQGEPGENLQKLFADLLEQCPRTWSVAATDYPDLFRELAAECRVRPRVPSHPRIHIWGLLESRMMQADTVILGGLNETTWPPAIAADPWLSRPMKRDLGLPPPERRIGLSAHDFAQAFSGSNLVLTRALKENGAPTVASRWLLRVEAVLAAAGDKSADKSADKGAGQAKGRAEKWLHWARKMDDPGQWNSCAAPAPRPPLAARPRRLSVSQIETHIRDPYAIYARHILALRPLEDLDAQLDAANRGTWIHDAMHQFAEVTPIEDPQKALETLNGISAALLEKLPGSTEAKAIWERRFFRAAKWFVAIQQELLTGIQHTYPEISGKISWPSPGGDFCLSARADRIDLRDDGTLAIYDYKTGTAPSVSQVDSGLAPQLALEAAIAALGGFDGEPGLKAATSRLAYIEITGGTPPGKLVEINKRDPAALASALLADLKTLIARFDSPEQAYHSRPHPKFEARFRDYDHLARVKEWMRGQGGAE